MAQPRLPALRELTFGQLDASAEASQSSELLLEGYFDHKEAALHVTQGNAWLLVGPKGSGKSAVYEHLSLKWRTSPMQFLSIWNLGGWPVGDVTKIRTGISEGDASAQGAWEFFLTLRLFDSLTQDQGASMDSRVLRIRRDLERLSLLGNEDLKTRFVDWTTTTAKFSILGIGGEASVSSEGVTLYQLAGILRDACALIATHSTHRLALDGLDQFFAETDADWRSLAGLIHAIQSVNIFMDEQGLSAGVVAAIRSEIFTAAPSTDSAKMLDNAVHLDWSDVGYGRTSRMWDMVNQKGRASIRSGFGTSTFHDVRSDYFSAAVSFGPYDDMSEYFLSNTRMLPRDVVALMHQIQAVHPGATPVSEGEARTAVRNYAERYFVAEIFNSLHGTVHTGGSQKVVAFKEALASLPKRYFKVETLMAELAGVMTKEELRPLLRRLFEIGAIGIRRGTPGNFHTDFVFRRSGGGSFSFLAEYCLHNALVVAWNVPWG